MIKISSKIISSVNRNYSSYFSPLSKISVKQLTKDVLNPQKPLIFEKIIRKFINIKGLRCLEVGAGFGINLIVWTKKFQIEGFGLEPDGEGFESSYGIARELLEENNIDKNRIIDAVGEKIPFPDNGFDFIFSSSVLEHVQNPKKVLDECLRVLKPGGVMMISYPNFHSFYDGHYGVLHPPIFSQGFFERYIKHICRRDPSFSKTLRTELNVLWTKKTLKELQLKYQFNILSLGEDLFLERMLSLNFASWAGLTIIKRILNILTRLKLNFLAAKFMLVTHTWGPIMVVLRKKNSS